MDPRPGTGRGPSWRAPVVHQRTRRGRISRAPRYRVTVPQDAR